MCEVCIYVEGVGVISEGSFTFANVCKPTYTATQTGITHLDYSPTHLLTHSLTHSSTQLVRGVSEEVTPVTSLVSLVPTISKHISHVSQYDQPRMSV